MASISDEEIIYAAEKYARNVPLEDQDDAQQEIAIVLLKARDRFDPSKGTWAAYSMVTALRAIRQFWRDHPSWDRSNARPASNTSYDNLLHEVPVDQEYESLDLEDLLCNLRRKDKVILLFMIAGYTARDIAAIMSISEGYIPNLLRHLRIKNSEPFTTQLEDTPRMRRVS